MSGQGEYRSSYGGTVALAAGAAGAALAAGSVSTLSGPQATQSAQSSLEPNTLAPEEASRFLAQATNGATRTEIDSLVTSGIESWLELQIAMPRSMSHWDWMMAAGYGADRKLQAQGWDNSIWRQLISAPDQLRQRVALALLDILVVSQDSVTIAWRNFAMAAYMDLLLDHAFGNYRALLGAISTNAAMARFLTFLDNRRETKDGAHPDENYARELMQLFTIGLYQLNQDGTEQVGADGSPIETYSQTDVSQMARIFTGLTPVSSDLSTPDRLREPLVINKRINERGPSTIFGHTVRGGGMGAINAALDILFAHPNVPPFVSRSLIQRLVTSNPTPDYVGRVASVFADNGHGERGDLAAVVRAILVDTEARNLTPFSGTVTGKLRDPIQRFTNWARAFKATSPSGKWAIGDLSDPATKLGQSPGRSPSVFNFFRPRYSPPNTDLNEAGLVAPEFQITTEESVIGYVNFMAKVVRDGRGDLMPDYGDMAALASDSQALVNEIDVVLAAGQLSSATLGTIQNAVESVSLGRSNAAQKRVIIAATLALASPEYIALS